jgi:hypothetical protein
MFIFGGTRLVMRAFLHYPQVWPTVLNLMTQAMLVGKTSESTHMMNYESVLHLPIPEAREALGFRNVVDMDTREMDLIYTEQVIPGEDQSQMQEAAE